MEKNKGERGVPGWGEGNFNSNRKYISLNGPVVVFHMGLYSEEYGYSLTLFSCV